MHQVLTFHQENEKAVYLIYENVKASMSSSPFIWIHPAWAGGRKADGADPELHRLLVEQNKFAVHVMVSARVCREHLHFVNEKAKVNSIVKSWYWMDSSSGKMALQLTWHASHRTGWSQAVVKDEWSPNSPNLTLLDYHVCRAMLKSYHKLQPKRKTIPELKDAPQLIYS